MGKVRKSGRMLTFGVEEKGECDGGGAMTKTKKTTMTAIKWAKSGRILTFGAEEEGECDGGGAILLTKTKRMMMITMKWAKSESRDAYLLLVPKRKACVTVIVQ